MSVSVDKEAPGELSTSSYTLQERLHRFAAFVVNEKKTTLAIDLILFFNPCGSVRSAFLVSCNRTRLQ